MTHQNGRAVRKFRATSARFTMGHPPKADLDGIVRQLRRYTRVGLEGATGALSPRVRSRQLLSLDDSLFGRGFLHTRAPFSGFSSRPSYSVVCRLRVVFEILSLGF